MYLPYAYLLILLKLLSSNAEGTICKTTEKCDCITTANTGKFEFQCPPNSKGSKTITHVYPSAKKLRIDCNMTDILDNSILPKASFGIVTKLYLQECPIPTKGFIEVTNSFNITNLEYLSFNAKTKNDTFTSKDFEGLNKLRILELKKSNITLLNGTTFLNTPHLSELMLDDSEIQLDNNIFGNIPELWFLSIHSNNIRYIPMNTFNGLSNLQRLDLWNNNLEILETAVFEKLTSLKYLELSLNKIKTFEEGVFTNLGKLVDISLRRNKLKNISRNIFKNCRNIELIRMDENPHLNLVDDVFSNFSYLKTVNLGNDQLETISETLFAGSASLRNIFLNYNRLKFLPEKTFKDLRNLEKLHLNNNQIQDLHPEIFSSLENLEYLYLQHNNLNTIEENLLKSLVKLKEIDLSYNKIVSMHPRSLARNKHLAKFVMNNNQFDFGEPILLRSNTPFSSYSCTNLKEVDLSYNKITTYPYDLNSITTMEEIKLQHNAIEEIKMDSLKSVNSEGVKINLEFNNISLIDFTDLTVSEQNIYPLTVIRISDNPIYCDCHALDLARYIQENNPPVKDYLNLKFARLNCAGPKKLKDMSLDEIGFKDLTCSLDKKCLKNDLCNCTYRSFDRSMIVDCSKRNLTTVPELSLSEIYDEYKFVDSNRIEVHLEDNQLERCPGEFDGYAKTTELYLQRNRIKNVTWLPPSVKLVDLSKNSIKAMDWAFLKLLNESRIEKLDLGGNPWRCDCDTKNISLYLKEHIKQVDMLDIRCNVTGKRLVDLNEIELCPPKPGIVFFLAIFFIACVIVTSVTLTFYYKYKKPILVWLYGRGICLWLVKEEELDKDKIYDAFICFSHIDEAFVTDKLISVLEGGDQPYKLCIHVRDFIPGELIQTQIVNSVRDSKRTVIVLSVNFLESVWGKVEFITAHAEAMKEGRARVIIVIYGDIDIDSVDKDLKAYLKTNTYIKWGDPWFWDKLKYALPRTNRRRNAVSKKHANMMQFIDDKFQLVNKQPISNNNTPSIILDAGNLEEKSLTCVA